MAELTEGTTDISATPSQVMAVITDFDSYPQWAGVKEATVLSRDAIDRPIEVAMAVSQMGFDARYTLAFEYTAEDAGLSWTTKEAEGVVKDIQGEYVLESTDDGTKVTYRLNLELNIALPGFLRKTAEKTVITTALDGLKKRVEGDA